MPNIKQQQGTLYTFGCSLTRYHWPTWADILGQSFENGFRNWANRGAGNRQILERLTECFTKTHFQANDVIIVQWTDHHRFDFHKWDQDMTESWYPGGNVFTNTHSDQLKFHVIDKVWNEYSFMMHTFNYITLAKALVKGCPAKVLFILGQDMREQVQTLRGDKNLLDIYENLFRDNIFVEGDLFNYVVEKYDTRLKFKHTIPGQLDDEKVLDQHPTPVMHYQFLRDKVQPKLGGIQIDHDFAVKMEEAVRGCDDYNNIGQAIQDAGYGPNTYYVRGL
tara:strand:+ start:22211 stop:23044 length:834 start_codon:yes stop_codon:yes gene_type:complete